LDRGPETLRALFEDHLPDRACSSITIMLGIKGPCPLLAESPGGTFEQPPQEIVKPKESKTMNEL
jgi:hypothetical protein